MHQDEREKPVTATPFNPPNPTLCFTELHDWITRHLAARAAIAPSAVDPTEPFQRLGLDSLGATAMLLELGVMLGRPLSPALVWEYPTPEALARYLDGAAVAAPPATFAMRGCRDDEPIAIVGMACRFPQASSPADFWRLLHDGTEAISEVPAGRWSEEVLGASGVDPAERARIIRGGFLAQIDGFDPLFFGISPREAAAMDPQQRLLLELVWEALEDSGIPPSSLKESRTAVFAASIWTDYGILLHRGGPEALGQHTITGYHHAILANRISYLFGLQGPSFTIDSACSSGLVCTHLACASLRRGESTMAFVAAANLNVLPESALGVSRFGALSPDGRCYTFDARANGYVRGEGAAVLVLKTLSQAIADGDSISCVIRGSAVNNDGPSNGLTAPNPMAQQALLREAYKRAGVSPSEVQYVEAHGTGTPLGDPIEAQALGAVLGAGRAAERPLFIGSAKTNIGHLEGAAGLVGLIKVALALKHRLLPSSLHFESANLHAPLTELGLTVPTVLGPWPAPSQRLTAGVSSFGLGGTNGHVVVQEWPAVPSHLFPLAAATPAALKLEAESQRLKMAGDGGRTPLAVLCAEAAKSAGPGPARVAVVARTLGELDRSLAAFVRGEPSPSVHKGGPIDASQGVVFVFPGQGAQWPGMALTLLQGEPAFRSTLERCDEYVQRYLGWSLLDELLASRESSRLGNIEVSLPAIISIDIAVATYYRSLGIEPVAVVGHSTGEIAAAHVAGALDLEDTMKIICAYGRLIGRFAGHGSMALVGLPWQEAARVLVGFEGRVFRAIKDSAAATVLAGEPSAIDELLDSLRRQGVFCRPVAMDVAPHCPLVDSLRDELLATLQGIQPRRGSVPLISEVTGTELDGARLDPAHWVRNFGDPALFSSAVDELIRRGHRVFLDVGPHPITKHSVEANLRNASVEGLVLSSLRQNEDARGTLLDALGALYAIGAPLRWHELYPLGNDPDRPDAAWLLPLSARSPEALTALAGAYDELLRSGACQVQLRDIAYTASVRRDHHAHRLAVVGRTREELRAALQPHREVPPNEHTALDGMRGRSSGNGWPKVVFVFPGQGSQWLGMGQTLLGQEPVFRAALIACEQAILAEAGFSVLAELAAEPSASQLERIDVVQPVLFAMAVALAALWRSWGVEPDAVVGHSLGEVAAAHIAGALSLADAAAIICRRSKLLRRISGQGEMAMVELSLAAAADALRGYETRLSVAVSNSPRSTVIAGDPAALAEVLSRLEAQRVFCRRVKVDVASHSPQVEPLREELLAALVKLAPQEARVPMHSTVTGALVRGPELGADYWVDNLRQPVRFGEVVQKLLESGPGLFIEISPHPILMPAVEELQQAAKREGAVVGSLRRGQPERAALLSALGGLWVKGHPVAWNKLFPAGGRRVALPSYPWQRQRYWVEEPAHPAVGPASQAQPGGHPLMGKFHTLSTQQTTHLWETTLDLKRLPWLAEHRVQGTVIFPGAAYVEMALQSGVEAFGTDQFAVTKIAFVEALALAADRPAAVQVVTTEEQPGQRRFQVATRVPEGTRGAFRVHTRALLRRAERAAVPARADLVALRARLRAVEVVQLYEEVAALGLAYGPPFQGITELWRGENEALGRVQLPPTAGSPAGYQLHPALLDACFQVMFGAWADDGGTSPWVPVEVDSLRLLQHPAGELWCHVRVAPLSVEAPHKRRADLLVVNSAGTAVVEILGLTVQRLTSSAGPREQDSWFLALDWERAMVPAQKPGSGRWLLLGAGSGLGKALQSALEAAGHAVVHAAEDSESAARLRKLLTDAFAGKTPTAIVHLGSLAGNRELDADAVELGLQQGCDSVLRLVQDLARMGYRDAPRLWLVTRGAQSVGGEEVAVAQAPLLGLGRVIALEHAELRCVRIDLDSARPADEVQTLLAELLADDAEEEIALRGGERRVSRLIHRRPEAVQREQLELATGRPFRLEIDKPGMLDHLVLRPLERRPPGPGEVEIAVEAAGLNFMDVMKALGIYPGLGDSPVALGGECSGRICAVGQGVEGLGVGQQVVAVAPYSFGSYVTVHAQMVVPRPALLNATQAAAVPLVFMTAFYGLVHLGRLQAGERVLIHSATGGTGMAAVQIARHLGAEVFATAGTPEKRDWLRAQGIALVMDSRSLDFAHQVLAATEGQGVDVVLNSLSGEAINASLSCLTGDGRFIELGKTDIYADRALSLAHFKKSLSYSAVDLAGLAERRPERFAALLREVMGLLAAGILKALPVHSASISRATEMFHKMAQAQHQGKLALTLADPGVQIRVPCQAPITIRPDSSYLVTGGLGGLGLSVAGWLAAQGAGQLVLVGRSGVVSDAQKAAVAALGNNGTRVTVARADVANRVQLEQLLGELTASGMPLRGIVHAAGLLDDGLLMQQSPARLRAVMAPKVQGALHLHELTRELRLDFFVMYSSAAGLLGSPGQGNYAAANTFLDALAHYRRTQGLPALSIDWGAFSEVGLAAAQDNRGARLAARGMRSLTPAEGLVALGRLLAENDTQAGVVPLNMRQWAGFNQEAAASRRLSRLWNEPRGEGAQPGGDRALLDRLAAAPPAARTALLEPVLRTQVSQVLRLPEGKLDMQAPLTNLGLDSLMGLELRNRIELVLGIKLSATLLWSYPTVSSLSEYLANAILETTAIKTPHSDAVSWVAVEGLSDDESARLIDEEFEALI